ncbi:Acyl-protein thioesterase 1 [Trichoplax sp. H2]|nr:Acyl-protein thioesterase 1 [Trichoplax sp. H2]|eukprot:RDD41335.1 Acyl-protein thioesterase 1 [Trichoplax sp. H2]
MCGNTSSMVAPFVINATAKQTATVIFLHGLGDTGYAHLMTVFLTYSINDITSHKFRFEIGRARFHSHTLQLTDYLNKPESPVTLNGGAVMPSWFDLISLSLSGPEDEKGIKASTNHVRDLISAELNNDIASNRIIIGGFSQGGAIALNTALTYEKKLGGIIGLSTFLVNRNSIQQEINVNKDCPIFQGHGDCDPLVNLRFGLMTKQILSSFNPNVNFVTYPGMMHSSCPQEMEDVKKFIDERLPNQ